MIEVFKTNVETVRDASRLVQMLSGLFPESRINFDLHDCDKVLRVEGEDFCNESIIRLLKEGGFNCSVLE